MSNMLREIQTWLVDRSKSHNGRKIPVTISLGDDKIIVYCVDGVGRVLAEVVLVHENGGLTCQVADESSLTRDTDLVFKGVLVNDIKF